ncbi:hypothetical protein A2230_03285 [candidate division WOR-1 bacterium RIFOXYA2_FULL_36_21]|uniref:Uncharacterized protein n=1 Tax=candidate division WOR-1 bacterium RIFOXYB2_FULL_36_35 TaxID=1802578 RepID=A0A1F4RXS5_UNCSA|nr:MAG: hypothetical protein A2230_03285 [candidate division WOR-1 bacterium RIFOXYA2_FULL_36_21]OGC12970.1 MAG: hypothetical protein A2290_04885 [candidate division WOR-1 bacterium RIFOXYB2_FULL_36_35]OGC19982.1 MAG: hypothetical protein A2282_08335 [candidate division WOR-1 bacterium RIFOXYA12_FULL_36_13]
MKLTRLLENRRVSHSFRLRGINDRLKISAKALETTKTALINIYLKKANDCIGDVIIVDDKNPSRMDLSIAYCDKVIALDPGLAEGWHEKGKRLLGIEDFKGAIDCFNKVVTLNAEPDIKAEALYYIGRWGTDLYESITCFDAALVLTPNDTRLLYAMAQKLLQVECYDQAILFYGMAINVDEGIIRIASLIERGAILLLQNHYSEALLDFNRAIRLIETGRHSLTEDDVNYQDLPTFLSNALNNKILALLGLNRKDDALLCFNLLLNRSLSLFEDVVCAIGSINHE